MNKRKHKNNNNSRKKRNITCDQLKLEIPETKQLNDNEFGHEWFDIELNLINTNSGTIYSSFKTINIYTRLLFNNGDVSNNISYQSNPTKIVLKNGFTHFKIKINTFSMNHNFREFKLVFTTNQQETGKFIQDFTSKSFKLVKYRIDITQQPNDIFYKDEGGKLNNYLTINGSIINSKNETIKNKKKMKIIPNLLYSNLDKIPITKNKHGIPLLGILDTDDTIIKNGKFCLKFRINDVSKNHNNQSFCLEIGINDNSVDKNIENVYSQNIFVKSKHPTKFRKKYKINKIKKKKIVKNEVNVNQVENDIDMDCKYFNKNNNEYVKSLLDWCKNANILLKKLEWKLNGYEFDTINNKIDEHRPIYKCSECGRYKDTINNGQHSESCELRLMLNEYNIKIRSMGLNDDKNTNLLPFNINEPSIRPNINLQNNENIDINNDNILLNNNNNNNFNDIRNDLKFPWEMAKIKSVKKITSGESFGFQNKNLHEAYDFNDNLMGLIDIDDDLFLHKNELSNNNSNNQRFNWPELPTFNNNNNNNDNNNDFIVRKPEWNDEYFYNEIKLQKKTQFK